MVATKQFCCHYSNGSDENAQPDFWSVPALHFALSTVATDFCVTDFFGPFCTVRKTNILLMAEILHHLGCMKPYKWWNGINYQPPLVSRISAINSIPMAVGTSMFLLKWCLFRWHSFIFGEVYQEQYPNRARFICHSCLSFFSNIRSDRWCWKSLSACATQEIHPWDLTMDTQNNHILKESPFPKHHFWYLFGDDTSLTSHHAKQPSQDHQKMIC